jgi:hypothetical protein
MAAFRAGDYNTAIPFLSAAAVSDAKNAAIRAALLSALVYEGKLEEAGEAAELAAVDFSDSPEAPLNPVAISSPNSNTHGRDDQTRRLRIENPPGFYIRMIERNLPVPEGFETSAKRKAREEREQRERARGVSRSVRLSGEQGDSRTT